MLGVHHSRCVAGLKVCSNDAVLIAFSLRGAGRGHNASLRSAQLQAAVGAFPNEQPFLWGTSSDRLSGGQIRDTGEREVDWGAALVLLHRKIDTIICGWGFCLTFVTNESLSTNDKSNNNPKISYLWVPLGATKAQIWQFSLKRITSVCPSFKGQIHWIACQPTLS